MDVVKKFEDQKGNTLEVYATYNERDGLIVNSLYLYNLSSGVNTDLSWLLDASPNLDSYFEKLDWDEEIESAKDELLMKEENE